MHAVPSFLDTKFSMLVVSQRHVSQLQKDVSFTTEQNVFYLLQLSNFLEPRHGSLRCDKHQKFHLHVETWLSKIVHLKKNRLKKVDVIAPIFLKEKKKKNFWSAKKFFFFWKKPLLELIRCVGENIAVSVRCHCHKTFLSLTLTVGQNKLVFVP